MTRAEAAWSGVFLALLPLAVLADEQAEFDRLATQYHAQYAAREYIAAEQTAIELVTLAAGPLRNQPERLGSALYWQAWAVHDQHRYADAESLYRQSLAIRQRVLGEDNLETAEVHHFLGWVYRDLGRYQEAEQAYQRALAIRQKSLGPDHRQVAYTLNELGLVYDELGRFREAEESHRKALAIKSQLAAPDDLSLAISLENLALAIDHQSRYAEAAPLYQRCLAIREKALGPDDPDVATTLCNLACLCRAQGRYEESETLHRRSLAIRKKAFDPEHPDVALSLNNLARLYDELGRYDEAEKLYRESLAACQKVYGPEHPNVAVRLNNLAGSLDAQGRLDDAERLYREALTIREKALSPEHPDVALSLNNLACVFESRGRYAEAETLHRRALSIREQRLGSEHIDVAQTVNNLASLLAEQSRFQEAEGLHRRALAIREKVLGPDHADVAASYNNLAELHRMQGSLLEAEPLYQKALDIAQKALGPEHPSLIIQWSNLALLHDGLEHYDKAEELYRRSLAMTEKVCGPNHPDTAIRLNNLAAFYHSRRRLEEAKSLIDRAITIRDTARIAPSSRFLGYHRRARILWDLGRRPEAVADLYRAMELAEDQRGLVAGGEKERAAYFADFASAFEDMAAWQLVLGNVAEAFSAAERSRARTLTDQLEFAGADLLAGAPEEQAKVLRKRDGESKSRVASLEQQLRILAARADLAPEERERRGRELMTQLAEAREELVRVYRDIRNASPAYRLAVGQDFQPLRLDVLQAWAAEQDAFVLEYFLGEEHAFLFVIPPRGQPQSIRLAVSQDVARELGIEPGPLSSERLGRALTVDGRGVQELLADPAAAPTVVRRLAALWRILAPPVVQAEITGGKHRRLVVVPDGPLALLPLEILVLDSGEAPTYLLDVCPPILYAPSATILYNLAKRSKLAGRSPKEAVLSVGDPDYRQADASGTARQANAAADLKAARRFTAAGGGLSQLPFSAWETTWVADVFGKRGIGVVTLTGREATEGRVRSLLNGRQLVHFACHGLVDQLHGNLFGALALTPGASEMDPDDDGFLTLAELYELNVPGCELAILSACDTNYGPQQRGEGVLALSRGFLVAGARRVAASNWLVDDRAAASLISVFCGALAERRQSGQEPDYAAALLQAKRWVSKRDEWRNPFFWGGFVLIGPN